MAVERSEGWDNEIIMITHGDCLEDAEYVAKLVREKWALRMYLSIILERLSAVIPVRGVVATFCMGNKR